MIPSYQKTTIHLHHTLTSLCTNSECEKINLIWSLCINLEASMAETFLLCRSLEYFIPDPELTFHVIPDLVLNS